MHIIWFQQRGDLREHVTDIQDHVILYSAQLHISTAYIQQKVKCSMYTDCI